MDDINLASNCYRILTVEDRQEVSLALCRTLTSRGHSVTRVASGREALEELNRNPYHALISDLGLPVMNGLALLKAARIMFPKTKRLLLLGRADMAIAVRALNDRAAHQFLLKPWTGRDIQGILEGAIRC